MYVNIEKVLKLLKLTEVVLLYANSKNDILPAPSGGVSFGYPKKDVFSASIPISSGSIHPRLKRRGFLEASNKSYIDAEENYRRLDDDKN